MSIENLYIVFGSDAAGIREFFKTIDFQGKIVPEQAKFKGDYFSALKVEDFSYGGVDHDPVFISKRISEAALRRKSISLAIDATPSLFERQGKQIIVSAVNQNMNNIRDIKIVLLVANCESIISASSQINENHQRVFQIERFIVASSFGFANDMRKKPYPMCFNFQSYRIICDVDCVYNIVKAQQVRHGWDPQKIHEAHYGIGVYLLCKYLHDLGEAQREDFLEKNPDAKEIYKISSM